MKIVGCDLHAGQQTIAMVDTETGEFTERPLPGNSEQYESFMLAWNRNPESGKWQEFCCPTRFRTHTPMPGNRLRHI